MNDRLDHLRKMCKEQNIDAFLISSSSNIYYLSGFNRFLVDHDGFLLVTQKNAYILTSPLYTEAVKKFTPEQAVLETTPDVWYSQMVKKVAVRENIKVIGFEEQDLRVAEYFDLQEEKLTLKSVSLRNLRIQKDAMEIQKIEKACAITDDTFDYIVKEIKEGMTELEVSAKMDLFVKSKGAEIGFPTIVAFGEHSAVPHHMTSDEKLKKNNFILLDFGIRYEGYLSDMSRTVFFGKPTDEQKKLYETVRKSQQAAIDFISLQLAVHSSQKNKTMNEERITNNLVDIFTKEVDKTARDIIEKANFIPYPHALGHGVGLEVHEAPTLSLYSPEKLIEGAVFTIEPGIYKAGMGGVRIEDVYVIENNKLRELTHARKDLIVIA